MRTFEVGDFVTDDLNAYGEAQIGGRLYVVMKVLPRDCYLIAGRKWGIKEIHANHIDFIDDGVPRPHITPSVVAGYWIQQLVNCVVEVE